jgi:ketosteroid isomerase-like protein
VSRENVEIVRRGTEHYQATGEFLPELVTPDFVWDMSKFRGWPEQQLYLGTEGAERFLREWTNAWDDWTLDIEAFHDVGEKVVVVARQHGRSKGTGMPVDMSFAQVYTMRDGRQASMEMYSDPAEALEAVGLSLGDDRQGSVG